jgi:hypothetical protein
MKEQILQKLNMIEESENITVLLAVETGSRAWGHSNENSDYDIRFIYRRNDISEYLVLDKFEDVYESDDGLFDFAGWDVKKALHLHFKSNPNLREWLISPTVYVPDEIGIFRNLPDFNPEILKHHYYGLAFKTNKKYIAGNDVRDVKIVKKTLYVIRCSLSWQILDKGIMPATDFAELIELSDVDGEVKDAILKLRDAYSTLTIDEVTDSEMEMIHTWIAESFDRFEKKPFKAPKRNIEDYNRRFQEIIGLRK